MLLEHQKRGCFFSSIWICVTKWQMALVKCKSPPGTYLVTHQKWAKYSCETGMWTCLVCQDSEAISFLAMGRSSCKWVIQQWSMQAWATCRHQPSFPVTEGFTSPLEAGKTVMNIEQQDANVYPVRADKWVQQVWQESALGFHLQWQRAELLSKRLLHST